MCGDLFFALWPSATWWGPGQAVDEYVELVCDHNLHHDRDRDFVLVSSRTGFALGRATGRDGDRSRISSGDYVFVIDDVSALVLHALFDLLRRFVDVRIRVLQHATTVFPGFDTGAVDWR